MNSLIRWLASLMLVLASIPTATGSPSSLHPLDLEVVRTAMFMTYHPDLRWRLDGLAELERGNFRLALKHFSHAARFADKASQAMVAEAHWQGRGTATNRALGYAWMDLAAERGHPMLIGKREHYWASLSASERALALDVGVQVYEEFGDAAALPRLDAVLKKGRRSMTGSRAGAGTGVRTIIPSGAGDSLVLSGLSIPFNESPGGNGSAFTTIGAMRISATGGKDLPRMWSDHFWNTEQYLAWKAAELDGDMIGAGVVDVLPLRTIAE